MVQPKNTATKPDSEDAAPLLSLAGNSSPESADVAAENGIEINTAAL